MKYVYQFFLILSINTYSYAQDTLISDTTAPEKLKGALILKEDFKNYYKSIGHIYSRPFHWKKKQWLTFGGVVIGTGLVSFLDKPIDRHFNERSSNFGDNLAEIGDFGGKPIPGYMLASGMYLGGFVFRKPKLRKAALTTFVAISSAGFFQTLVKGPVGRARPSQGRGHLEFRPLTSRSGFTSFPSGHTIVAMSTSFALAKSTDFVPLKILCYSWGGVTAWSRMYDQAHWFSDIVFATFISWLTVETTDKYLTSRAHRRKSMNRGISMDLSPTFNGLSLQLRW